MSEQFTEQSLFDVPTQQRQPVECLGLTFEDEQARRAYFTEELLRKLQSQDFRDTEGFPDGEIEDILAMSDPPYYTACPNPFLEDFIQHYGKPYDPDVAYDKEPFATDVSEGKNDPIYNAHSYHTKVPHKAIIRYILHYTQPGDIVLDGFSGTGMTGVAAQMCGSPDLEFKKQVEAEWKSADMDSPKWGARRAILNDLSPVASFISANYNLPFDIKAFEREAKRILKELKQEIGWMYETRHPNSTTKGQINYTVWSEVFSCPNCSNEITFLLEALDQETQKVREEFPCPHCKLNLTKSILRPGRLYEIYFDSVLGKSVKRIKRLPVLINYSIGKVKYEKWQLDDEDFRILDKIADLPIPSSIPTIEIPFMHMTHQRARMEDFGITHIHHFHLPRQIQALGRLWRKAEEVEDRRLQNMLLFFVEQAIWGMSLLARYVPTHYSQVNRHLPGVYYLGSQIAECSPWYILDGKLKRLVAAFSKASMAPNAAMVTTGTAAKIGFPDKSIDYIFTDPPFGENIYYADLNFLVESWHQVRTNAEPEAIIDKAKSKKLFNYQHLMQDCFYEYARVLKPGRWMTVVFHNSRNGVWNAIQEAMLRAGFVVADVRTLDKQQGSYRQVTSTTAKQDLVISAYKPNGGLEERFAQRKRGDEENVWDFVRTHLDKLPMPQIRRGQLESLPERMNYLLFDRMVAFHLERERPVPLSAPEFYAGLEQRFAERDRMYFLPEQVAAYDKKRMSVEEVSQLDFFVTDEKTAIRWLQQELDKKPQTFPELQPKFLREIAGWAKHEKLLELSELLDENFLCYDGKGEVPSQIHAYLSSNYKELRNLPKDSSTLRAKAKDRWYIPNPSDASQREKLRLNALLREFDTYVESKQRQLKVFRLEAMRAGFERAFNSQDYQTIIDIADKIPAGILEEDTKLLTLYDLAQTRMEK
jgi:DNA modification methylase